MKDIPILFSGVMIQALLAGRKTNSRRISEAWMKVKAGDRLWVRETWCAVRHGSYEPIDGNLRKAGYDQSFPWTFGVQYAADFQGGSDPDYDGHWRPSIFMPRWASRITLEATEDARREPLADISEADAIAEGIWGKVLPASFGMPESMAYYWGSKETSDLGGGFDHARQAFHCLWDSINGKTAPVSSNPVPVRLAFRVVA